MVTPSRPPLSALTLLVAAALMLTACAAKPLSCQSTWRPVESPATPLALPSEEMLAAQEIQGEAASIAPFADMYAWEYARRDDTLGQAAPPYVTDFGIAEIRHREHLRTANGRPRDDSWTRSRSIQRRVRP